MPVTEIDLIQFVGAVIPISLIALRVFLDNLQDSPFAPDLIGPGEFTKHTIAMVLFLVLAAWMAVFDMWAPRSAIPFVKIGFLFAAVGVSVPLAMLRKFWKLIKPDVV